jgi:hypothetical protein
MISLPSRYPIGGTTTNHEPTGMISLPSEGKDAIGLKNNTLIIIIRRAFGQRHGVNLNK